MMVEADFYKRDRSNRAARSILKIIIEGTT